MIGDKIVQLSQALLPKMEDTIHAHPDDARARLDYLEYSIGLSLQDASWFKITPQLNVLSSTLGEQVPMDKLAQFARLPATTTWIEGEFMVTPEGNIIQAGFLLGNPPSDDTCIQAIYIAWHQDLQFFFPSNTILRLYPARGWMEYGEAPWFESSRNKWTVHQANDAAVKIASLLALINSPPLCSQREVVRSSRKPERQSQSTKDRFVLCEINIGRTNFIHSEGGGSPEQTMRLHLQRGHFKARKTGIFWWNPHWRGEARLGRVEKRYEATA